MLKMAALGSNCKSEDGLGIYDTSTFDNVVKIYENRGGADRFAQFIRG